MSALERSSLAGLRCIAGALDRMPGQAATYHEMRYHSAEMHLISFICANGALSRLWTTFYGVGSKACVYSTEQRVPNPQKAQRTNHKRCNSHAAILNMLKERDNALSRVQSSLWTLCLTFCTLLTLGRVAGKCMFRHLRARCSCESIQCVDD